MRRIQADGTFGRDRALLIAQTETTRAYAEAEEIAYRESGCARQGVGCGERPSGLPRSAARYMGAGFQWAPSLRLASRIHRRILVVGAARVLRLRCSVSGTPVSIHVEGSGCSARFAAL